MGAVSEKAQGLDRRGLKSTYIDAYASVEKMFGWQEQYLAPQSKIEVFMEIIYYMWCEAAQKVQQV